MKFPKFVNKKMIIFIILFSAFLYFSGSFNVMREGYTPLSTLIAKNMSCSKCLSNGQSYLCSDECKTFVSDNNITSSKYKAHMVNQDTYFVPLPPKIFKGNCTGCRLEPNPTNLPCDTGPFKCKNPVYTGNAGIPGNEIANAKDYNCVYDEQAKITTCYLK